MKIYKGLIGEVRRVLDKHQVFYMGVYNDKRRDGKHRLSVVGSNFLCDSVENSESWKNEVILALKDTNFKEKVIKKGIYAHRLYMIVP